MSIYKACDIRGRFGTELTPRHAERLGTALSHLYPRSSILIGGDGRLSTPLLKEILISELVRLGWQVVDLGSVSTPLFYFARRTLGIDLGVMVTASHNPAHDNGFKLTLGPLPVTEDDVINISKIMDGSLALDNQVGGEMRQVNLWENYVAFLQSIAPDLTGLKVVLDCANGMASLAARRAWEKTGAEVVYLLDQVDGNFPAHAPNPAEAKNMVLLSRTVLEYHAHLGAAYDGDGDRVGFVDDQGNVIPSDAVIVLFSRDILREGKQTIVFDQKCSRIVPETIRQLGGTPIMERSGHTYIKRTYLENNAAYAGELSGHHFIQAAGGDDGIAASLFFARMQKMSAVPLSKLLKGIPSYPITPDLRIPMTPENIQTLVANLKAFLGGEARLETLDGLRVEFDDGWGLVRPSVTEPVVTMRFEGQDDTALRRIMARFEAGSALLRGKLLK